MRDWLAVFADHLILVIHAMALLVVAFGTVQAFVQGVRAMFERSPAGHRFHHAYVQYARWLVAALTFQLAADIVETAFTPEWDEIGRLAAIAELLDWQSLGDRQRQHFESQQSVGPDAFLVGPSE